MDLPGFTDLTRQMSVTDKLCQCDLLGLGCSLIVIIFSFFVSFHQFRRQYHITDPDRRKQHFGKCSQINDISSSRKSLQRRNRFLKIFELTVIVIFNDQKMLFLSASDQFQSFLDRHHPTKSCHL